jgi:hypothetical protein
MILRTPPIRFGHQRASCFHERQNAKFADSLNADAFDTLRFSIASTDAVRSMFVISIALELFTLNAIRPLVSPTVMLRRVAWR